MKTKLKKTLKTADKKAYKKAWDEANRDKIKAYTKEYGKGYRAAVKLQFYVVYTIDNYDGKGSNYCGVTSRPDVRMRNHKSKGKLNTKHFTIVEAQVEKADALAIEAEYHSKGYDGAYGWKLKKEAA